VKYIIVDDNKLARMAVKHIASGIPDIEFVGECESASQAMELINKESIDFILLDIEMPEMNGLELAKHSSAKKVWIIFTTGKTEYAIDAFETNVVDYVVKPVSIERLTIAIDKLKETVQNRKTGHDVKQDYFYLKDKGALIKIVLSDVLYFEALGDYVKIYTMEKKYAMRITMKNIETKLDFNDFVRVHRSYIVALSRVDKIKDNFIIIGDESIPIADSYKKAVLEKMKSL
jgi:two-component system LytT family response regulator